MSAVGRRPRPRSGGLHQSCGSPAGRSAGGSHRPEPVAARCRSRSAVVGCHAGVAKVQPGRVRASGRRSRSLHSPYWAERDAGPLAEQDGDLCRQRSAVPVLVRTPDELLGRARAGRGSSRSTFRTGTELRRELVVGRVQRRSRPRAPTPAWCRRCAMSADAEPCAVRAVEVRPACSRCALKGVDRVVEHGEAIGSGRSPASASARLAPLRAQLLPSAPAYGVVVRDDPQPVRLEDHHDVVVADARPRTRRSRPRTLDARRARRR